MADENQGEHTWRDGFDFDAAAESVRLGKRRFLEGAARIGEQLSGHLAQVPVFMVDEARHPRWKQLFESWSKRITIASIMKLVVHRKRVKATLQEIPVRMQLVTNQVRLVLELIDDFAAGTYRDVPWHSMAVAAGAILYSVSPTDIVPDVLPLVGSLDDLFLIGMALKLIEKDLRAYAESKGYDLNDYFPEPGSSVPPKAPADAKAVVSDSSGQG
jgi:uncharacterized membrane protein YkvA (DUF1232 family)